MLSQITTRQKLSISNQRYILLVVFFVLCLFNVHTVLISLLTYISHDETFNVHSTLHSDKFLFVCFALLVWCEWHSNNNALSISNTSLRRHDFISRHSISYSSSALIDLLFDPQGHGLYPSENWLQIFCDVRYPMLFLTIVSSTASCLFVFSAVCSL